MFKDEDMIMPMVSVCITTYNRADLLPFAIESVLNQYYTNLEIIIVDDCSTDETAAIIEEFTRKDSRIRFVQQKENKGLATARNVAIFSAKGEYFTFIDDDDEWAPEYVGKFVNIAQQFGPKHIFCCGIKEYSRSGRRIEIIPHFDDKLFIAIMKGNIPIPSSQFYHTAELQKIGGYNEQIKSGVDHDLWLTLSFHGYYVKAIQEALTTINPRAEKNVHRMTTNWKKRLEGITASLDIWKTDIVSHIGADFFKHFRENYFYFTYKSFFIASVKRMDFMDAIFFFWRCPNKCKLISSLCRSFIASSRRLLGVNSAYRVRVEDHQFSPFNRQSTF